MDIQILTDRINGAILPIMEEHMSDMPSGDETPDQAVQWDYHVDALARLMLEIKQQNS